MVFLRIVEGLAVDVVEQVEAAADGGARQNRGCPCCVLLTLPLLYHGNRLFVRSEVHHWLGVSDGAVAVCDRARS